MSLTSNLKVWRKDRNITQANTRVYVANVIEELLEIYYTDKQYIKEEKDAEVLCKGAGILCVFLSHVSSLSEKDCSHSLRCEDFFLYLLFSWQCEAE